MISCNLFFFLQEFILNKIIKYWAVSFDIYSICSFYMKSGSNKTTLSVFRRVHSPLHTK